MTASRQRLVSAIRGIARTDPDIANAIAKTSNRGGQPGSSASASSSGEESRICCVGSTSGNANPGTSQRNPDGEDADQDGLDSNDPANLDMGGGSLTGLTDCAAGEPVCFEGDDWLPPEGWDSPTDPPIDPTWQEGYSWVTSPGSIGATPRAAAENCTGLDCCLSCEGGVLEEYSYDESGAVDEYEFTNDCGHVPGGCQGTVFVSRIEDAENTESVLADAWPADSCVNLAIKNGTIVGSKYDPENDGAYSKPMAELRLCDGAGNQVNIKPSADGGWKSIDPINGGDGYLYNAQGEQIARISEDEYNDPLI